MTEVTHETVRGHFDTEADEGRRLLPDPDTVTGLGTFVKYEKAVTLMADPEVHRVLDIGCNRGSIEALFHQRHPEKAARTAVDGVDISPKAIEQAQSLGLPGCTFRTYGGVVLPLPDMSIDLVVMVEVIEHVMQKEELLKEVHRVLRPGGKFFFTTPNPDCWTLRFESFIWRMLRVVFRRRQLAKDSFISGPALESLVREVGLESTSGQRLYFWPHVFVAFEGWGLLPPLPPRWLFGYQKYCAQLADRITLPGFLDRRLKWTLAGLYRKRENTGGSVH